MYCKGNGIIRGRLLPFFVICLLLSVSVSAQFNISNINPEGERGSSFIQVITVDQSGTPSYDDDSIVQVQGMPNITWQSIADWDTGGFYSYHRGSCRN